MTDTTRTFAVGDIVIARHASIANPNYLVNPRDEHDIDMGIRTGEAYRVKRLISDALVIEGEKHAFSTEWFDRAPFQPGDPVGLSGDASGLLWATRGRVATVTNAETVTIVDDGTNNFNHRFDDRGEVAVPVADLKMQSKAHEDRGYLKAEPEAQPEPEPEPEAPVEPTIDFSGTGHGEGVDRSKAREYAVSLMSRVNKPATNEVLHQVAQGAKAVDALDLNRAIVDALRHVSTRFSGSTARREHASKAAHLHYIVQAVLANHIAGLPAYEQGVRSRKIETLEGEVAALKTAGEAALAETEKTTAALKELQVQHAVYRERADAEVTRVLDLVAQRNQEIANLTEERDTLAAVLGYAIERLAETDRERVMGYWDALQPGRD